MKRYILSRRTFLRGTGVSLSLPLLDAMLPLRARAALEPRRRLVAIDLAFGLHAPLFYPEGAGRDYRLSPYLEPIGRHRDHFTVITGTSHPEVDGGHLAEAAFLTAARHPGSSSFKNTISVDQVAAEQIGDRTRFGYLALSTGREGLSFSRSGVAIPADTSPSAVFRRLFLAGSKDQVAAQVAALRDGRSVMDTVLERARRLQQQVGKADQEKLDQYFTAVRETERRLAKAEDWMGKPKPRVDAEPPLDIPQAADVIGQVRLMYSVVHLALQTDSTRLVTFKAAGTNQRPPIEGVRLDYHNLTHHGKDPDKIAQLRLIELAQMQAFAELLDELAAAPDGEGSVLDQTIVLFGSTLGNGSSHDNKNLPVVLAGGGFAHGQHLAFDAEKNEPLANLFVSILQRLGLEVDRFASSTGTLRGLEPAK